jgi:hypothetical protein
MIHLTGHATCFLTLRQEKPCKTKRELVIVNKDELKDILKSYSKINTDLTRHCRERMFERNVTVEDLRFIIEWGEIVEVEESPRFGDCKCKLQGTDIDGNELTFVAVVGEGIVLCITVF